MHRPRTSTAAIAVVTVFSLLAGGCSGGGGGGNPGGGNPGGGNPGGGNPGGQLTAGTYSGTMTTRVHYYTELGQYYGSADYPHNVLVDIGPPAAAGGFQENNPFQLIVRPAPPSTIGVDIGTFSLFSGAAVTDPSDGRSVLITMWDLDFDGRNVTGTLVNPNNALTGTLFNTLTAYQNVETFPIFFSFATSRGATLSGTVTNTEIALRIEGVAYALTGTLPSAAARQFVVELVARR